MNNKHILATMLIALAVAVPASGYHITGTAFNLTPPGIPPGTVPLTSADFVVPNPLLILCEDNGPSDLLPDPPVPTGTLVVEGQPGIGGLCHSGRNAASVVTGTSFGTATGDWTELDVCTEVSMYVDGDAARCTATEWGYGAELGVYFCFVEPDQSLVYDEDYAAMSYGAAGNGHVALFPDLLSSDILGLATTVPYPLATLPAPLGLLVGSALAQAITEAPEGSLSCGSSDPFSPVIPGPIGVNTLTGL